MRVPATLAVVLLFGSHPVSAQGPNAAFQAKAYITVDAPTVALTHVRVIDGTGAPPAEDQTIVVSNGRIQAVGPAASVAVPAGARTLDYTGRTVIPGLIGMHDHTYYTSAGREMEMPFSSPRLYLGTGVTTIRTIGSIDPYTELNMKKSIEAGVLPGPRMFISGPYVTSGGNSLGRLHLDSPEDARKTVAYWGDEGVRWFKAYTGVTHDQLKAFVDEAHKRGLKVTGHLCSIGFTEAAEIGIDNLEHGWLVDSEFDATKKPDECPRGQRGSLEKIDVNSEPVQKLIKTLVAKNVAITSTLAVWETFVPNRPPLDQRVLDAMTPQVRAEVLTQRSRIAEAGSTSPMIGLFEKEKQFERAFVKAGGVLVAGIDPTGYGAAVPGYGDQRQVELLVEAGFTPVEAIQIATLNGAKLLGEGERLGSIATGKVADLVVIKGNPAAKIADLRNVEVVFKDGKGYDSAKLLGDVNGRLGLQ
jgi:imidazolonepropionase-like amidohydrolase